MGQEDQNVTAPETGAEATQETIGSTSQGGASSQTPTNDDANAPVVSPGQATAPVGATQPLDPALQTLQVVNSLAAATSSAQQEFDGLVARKVALWNSISRNTLYELSAEWKEIQAIDERLHVLWGEGKSGVVRKEDK